MSLRTALVRSQTVMPIPAVGWAFAALECFNLTAAVWLWGPPDDAPLPLTLEILSWVLTSGLLTLWQWRILSRGALVTGGTLLLLGAFLIRHLVDGFRYHDPWLFVAAVDNLAGVALLYRLTRSEWWRKAGDFDPPTLRRGQLSALLIMVFCCSMLSLMLQRYVT